MVVLEYAKWGAEAGAVRINQGEKSDVIHKSRMIKIEKDVKFEEFYKKFL